MSHLKYWIGLWSSREIEFQKSGAHACQSDGIDFGYLFMIVFEMTAHIYRIFSSRKQTGLSTHGLPANQAQTGVRDPAAVFFLLLNEPPYQVCWKSKANTLYRLGNNFDGKFIQGKWKKYAANTIILTVQLYTKK